MKKCFVPNGQKIQGTKAKTKEGDLKNTTNFQGNYPHF